MVINTETRTGWYPASKDAEHSALNVCATSLPREAQEPSQKGGNKDFKRQS